MKRTPLYSEHLAAGARMVEFAGWELPVQYRSILDEHRRVRSAVGLFDVSHMGEIELSGCGAEACCARLFANDPRQLAAGQAQYSLLVNEDGGIVDDVILYRLAAQRFFVCVNAANVEKDFAWIRRHATDGCRSEDQSSRWALLSVQGPKAGAVVLTLAPKAANLARFAVASMEISGAQVLVARTGYTGEDGFELFVDCDRAVSLWRLLLERGRPEGMGPVGLGARDTLRLEAALPLYGHELSEQTSPYEAGLDWVVKLNRPDMIGYAALCRAARGSIGRRLVGLEIEGGIARHGHAVVASGRKIGMVTSGSSCPTVGRAVALALIEHGADSGELAVDVRGKLRGARVTKLPFYVSRNYA